MSINSNEKDLNDLYELAKKLEVNYWRLNRYQPANLEKAETLKLTPEKFHFICENLSKKIDFDISSDPIFSSYLGNGSSCPCGYKSFRIKENGEVTPCVFINSSGGNILYEDMEKIYNSSIFRELRKRNTIEECVECHFYEKCRGGCAAAAYLAYGNFNHKDPLCWNNIKSLRKATKENYNIHKNYLCTIYIPIR